MNKLRRATPLILLALALLAVLSVAAGGTQPFWYSIDGSGYEASGGSYTLRGSVGQPDAGLLSGGTYNLQGGFWFSGGSVPTAVNTLSSTATSPSALLLLLTFTLLALYSIRARRRH